MANLREHWAARASRNKLHRELVGWSLKTTKKPELPCAVVLTRIAPRFLDGHDNLRVACKAAVDAIAEWPGIDDADKRVEWRYAQEHGKPKTYALRIEFA